MILAATIGGVLALFFWGASDYLLGKSGKVSDEYLTNFVVQTIGALIFIPVVVYYGLSIEIDIYLLLVALIALLFTVTYVTFVKALTIGPYGVAAPLANSYALVTLLIGLLFFNFQISALQFLLLALVVVGVVFLTVDKTTFSLVNVRKSTVYFSFITLLGWGIGFALIDVAAKHFSWYELLFLIGVCMSVFGFFYYVIVRRKSPVLKEMYYHNMKYAWWAGMLLSFGSIAFFSSVEIAGSVAIPAVLASASPLVTSFFAYYWDKEQLTIFKRIGALIIVASIMLLNLL